MPRRGLRYIILLFLIALAGCSTTKVLPDGESRLKQNHINILNSKSYPESELLGYVKQKPNTYFIFGWNPFLNIYNWSNGKGNGWDRFVKKIGQEPVVFDPDLIESSKKNIGNHLVYQGYYNSTITDTVRLKKKLASVEYRVNLGKRYVIDSVAFHIPDTRFAADFYRDSLQNLIQTGEYLSEEYLGNCSAKIADHMRTRGYFRFSKNYLFFSADTLAGNGKALLDVEIRNYTRNEKPEDAHPHTRFKIGQVSMNPIRRPSEPFTYTYVGDSIVAMPTMNLNEPTDSLVYKDIKFKYRDKLLIRKKVLSRMNYVYPQTLYNEKTVADTYTRLTNLKLFSGVNIQMDQVDSNTVDCNMKLTASELQGYKVGFEASINSTGLFGISPNVSYYHKNLFRGAEVLTVNLMGDFQFAFKNNKRAIEFGASASLNFPNFLLLPDRIFKGTNIPSTEVSFSYNFQKRPEYTRNIISGAYSYNWTARERFFYKVTPLQVNIVKLYNVQKDFYDNLKDPFLKNSYQDHFDFGLGSNFYYTSDPAPRPEHSYFYLRWQNDLAGNVLSLFNRSMDRDSTGARLIWGSRYSQYYRTELSLVYTWKFGKKENHSVAARFQGGVGIGYGNSKTLPFEKLFWSGGAYSLRAWQARTVGPGYAQRDSTFTIPNQTGDVKLELNLEYRFPLFWNFEGALFADAGNVWNIKRSLDEGEHDPETIANREAGVFHFRDFYKNVGVDWGLGLRLDLKFVLLRLDLGVKVYDPAQSSALGPNRWFKKGNYGVQFGVGYPF